MWKAIKEFDWGELVDCALYMTQIALLVYGIIVAIRGY